jgi:phosphonate ABC transporter permease subunit PhnE
VTSRTANDKKQDQRKRRTWIVLIFVVFGFLTYAYGVDATGVTLEEIEDEQRQTNLFRILRALAHPDILERDTDEVQIAAEIYVPCQANQPAPLDDSGAYIEIVPPCGDPETDVVVRGQGFAAGSEGPISFIPPSGVSLGIGEFIVEEDGTFETTVTLKDRPSEEVQFIRVTARQEVGSLHFTETARLTLDFALETVFMALLATTIGTFLAIPLSFLASRNLMRPIKSPMVSIALGIVGLPVGIWVGASVARLAQRSIEFLTGNAIFSLGGALLLGAAIWYLLRILFPEVEPDEPPSRNTRLAHAGLGLVIAIAATAAVILVGDFLISIGNALGDSESWFRREDVVNDIGAGVFAQLGSLFGRFVVSRVPSVVDRTLRYLTAALAGAVIAIGVGKAIEWLYQWDDLARTFWIPAAVGAILGLSLAFATRKADQVATGLTIYYLARTLFNTLRSIEPLVMAIIFVVWVGVGPFAGALALALHTTAALAKLYSEQVESISQGPIEAVQATGANRLQTVMYAVVPQIVPPYISFTLYRWDINVRMSTIIGFVGGGGLGLLLQQNVNLLQYRAAAVQMFAIAIIVASMDYISARLRERLV